MILLEKENLLKDNPILLIKKLLLRAPAHF